VYLIHDKRQHLVNCPGVKSVAMKYLCVFAFAAPLLAQPITLPGGSIPTPIVLQQTYTTGMVGFTTNQTARLNVFNSNPIPAASSSSTTTAQPAPCTVELQFYDSKGTLVGQSVVPAFAPAASTLLDLTRAAVTPETAVRAEIRGVVVINPAPTPVGSPAPVGNCSVLATLEIFDASGSTVAFTSDVRLMPGLYAVIASHPLN
jgi:hypothetical protein